jgi:hypothetical protein
MTKKQDQINDIVNSIMDRPAQYYDLIQRFVKAGVSQWSQKEIDAWSTPE